MRIELVDIDCIHCEIEANATHVKAIEDSGCLNIVPIVRRHAIDHYTVVWGEEWIAAAKVVSEENMGLEQIWTSLVTTDLDEAIALSQVELL